MSELVYKRHDNSMLSNYIPFFPIAMSPFWEDLTRIKPMYSLLTISEISCGNISLISSYVSLWCHWVR
ncbi:hypothetical protein [Methanobrevibacter sp.]|uniref:hypothetical protein n=1 Tax=Methanobrevibacter sp. TaxID=66852 RepID=UPI0025D7A062|nr:hypothetical protein [Methanobrevibacter sp.]